MLEFLAKPKWKVLFLRTEYNSMNVVKVLTLKAPIKVVKQKDKSFIVNWEIPTYTNKLDKIYFVNWESGSQFTFNELKHALNPQELDLFLSGKIIKDLVSGSIDNKSEKIMFMIMGAIMGFLLGFLICQIYMQQKMDELVASQQILTFPTL